ncbi:putative E3 ubiquitin-protein ligase BAH1 [Helianthus anomalus]
MKTPNFWIFVFFLSLILQVHKSVSCINFKSKLQAEHLEISQSPWLIELVALYLNFNESNHMIDYKLHDIPFSCDLTIAFSEPLLRLVLPSYANLEYNLTCPICLVRPIIIPIFHIIL